MPPVRRSLKVLLVVRFDEIVDLLRELIASAEPRSELLTERNPLSRRPGFRSPKPRTLERLGAVEIASLDGQPDGEKGRLAPRGKALEDLGIGGEECMPLNSKGLLRTWDHEDRGNLRIREDVLEAEDKPVPLSVRDQKGIGVFDGHESSLVTFGRDVGETVFACGGEYEKRRPMDEGDGHLIQGVHDLERDCGIGLADDIADGVDRAELVKV